MSICDTLAILPSPLKCQYCVISCNFERGQEGQYGAPGLIVERLPLPTDWLTDRPTDQPMDTASHRGALSHLKTESYFVDARMTHIGVDDSVRAKFNPCLISFCRFSRRSKPLKSSAPLCGFWANIASPRILFKASCIRWKKRSCMVCERVIFYVNYYLIIIMSA